jgi:hypothetical protein
MHARQALSYFPALAINILKKELIPHFFDNLGFKCFCVALGLIRGLAHAKQVFDHGATSPALVLSMFKSIITLDLQVPFMHFSSLEMHLPYIKTYFISHISIYVCT